MVRYEVLMLSIPEITRDEAESLELQFDKLIQAYGGSLISFERWGKYLLAYPVKKNDYGVYFLARFQADVVHDVLKEIKMFFAVKVNEIVMRHMISRLGEKQLLTYQRPHSLEESPSKEVGSFLRDKKIGSASSQNDDRVGQQSVTQKFDNDEQKGVES